MSGTTGGAEPGGDLLCPFDLTVDTIEALLNGELADHGVYDGFELQWFDDAAHGTGLLAFLSRRADRRVDYYLAPGLRLDRDSYAIGGGIGAWVETDFERGVLQVTGDGVVADVCFRDVEGRLVEITVDDRGAGRRSSGDFLAPVSSAIESPVSLMLVWMHGFDLLRRTGVPPVVRIDGDDAAVGTLPGAVLHRRHLVKAAAPLTVATVCRARSGALVAVDPAAPGDVRLDPDGAGIAGLVAHRGVAETSLTLQPPLPPLSGLAEGVERCGSWEVGVDRAVVTGGTWRVLRRGERVALVLQVTRPWRPPPGLPLLMRVVTRVVPVFRGWPTTYRWTCEVDLAAQPAVMSSRWQRTGTERGDSYRRATRRRRG